MQLEGRMRGAIRQRRNAQATAELQHLAGEPVKIDATAAFKVVHRRGNHEDQIG